MSKRSHHIATQGIRAWTTEQVQKVLIDNGLEECCEAIKKRSVDGDNFLTLTEGQLALWKRDMSLSTIKKLARFVQDVITNPEKYVQTEVVTASQNTYIPPAVPASPIRNGSPMSDNVSWDTDFDDDLTSPVTVKPPEIVEDDVEYANSEALEFIEKPPIPARPLVLPPKPIQSVSPPACNLPKPPVLPEDNCYGHVKTLVNNLDLEDNPNEFDEEDYESLDNETLAMKLKKTLEQRKQGNQMPPAVQPSQSTIISESGQLPSPYPPVLPKKPSNEEHVLQGNVNDGFECDEYESINEQDKAVILLSGEATTEYYLQPVKQTSEQNGAPPLPVKLWNKPQVATMPSASPPRKKSDDSSSSPGNSGDGVAWGLGEFFRKKFLGPSTSNPLETRERTPTPELKKTPTISHKPPPPPVDHRPSTFPNNHRPLPPTPEDSKTNRSRRSSRVSLTQQPWYHNVDRSQGEVLLRNGEDGSFLVRPSARSQNALTLMLWFNKRLYNINIRHRNDGRYALGTEKPNEQSFNSVEELVQNYQSEKLVLYSGGERERTGRTLLTSTPPQSSELSA
ncbi:B-cell linker protein isoform X2 [Periplaneta americana]|uniref:B-cell linker protein isoform X2 n=1 Tax=Periplaneta americana TaxID=6978 RepID=UPI0037E7847F